MIFRSKQYRKFLIKSTNQHGVHSPFVYDMVTQCFYNKEKRASYPAISTLIKQQDGRAPFSIKTAKLLNRIPAYFEHKKAIILSQNSEFVSEILSLNNTIEVHNSIQFKGHYDLVYMDLNTLMHYLNTEALSSIAHNNSVIIINSMYQSEVNATAWEKIKTHPKITVTVDTFGLGFVFIRKEQAKENFIIRL